MSESIKNRIEAYFVANGPCRGSEVRCRFGIPHATWHVYVHELREAGRICRVGEERFKGRVYPVYNSTRDLPIDRFLRRPAPGRE